MLGIFLFFTVSMSPAADRPSDADILAANMPAMQLWSDSNLMQIHGPYLTCYAQAVEGGAGSRLKNDDDVEQSLRTSSERCGKNKAAVSVSANTYIAGQQPSLTAAQRDALLSNYRRHMGLFALIVRYRERGRSSELFSYFDRLAEEARLGRSPVMLTAE